jgi:hypothetical protein
MQKIQYNKQNTHESHLPLQFDAIWQNSGLHYCTVAKTMRQMYDQARERREGVKA